MFDRLPTCHGSGRIIRHRRVIVLAWIVVAITLRWFAPAWRDIAADGDFDYLPVRMNSVAGDKMLREAFPGDRARSQIAIIVARDGPLLDDDKLVAADLSRRLNHHLAIATWKRLEGADSDLLTAEQRERSEKIISEALDRSIAADETFYERIAPKLSDDFQPSNTIPRLAVAYWDRGRWLEKIGADEQAIGQDFEAALLLAPEMATELPPPPQRPNPGWQNLIDLMSWDDPMIGGKMSTDQARLMLLQLSSELAATENIETVDVLSELLDDVRDTAQRYATEDLQIAMSGSAAIGGETLVAARDSIRYTESITVIMILLILCVVYRAPLLVAVPMISIGIAVVTATSLVSLLAADPARLATGDPVWGLRIFTTSRIFIVVILFGAGTDYCLFLISRLREEAGGPGHWHDVCRRSLRGVVWALVGSALTTVIGLGMLGFADFGKFRWTGPVIAICLTIGLLVCLTLTPALLAMVGPKAFWPVSIARRQTSARGLMNTESDGTPGRGLWSWIAIRLTRYPLAWLLVGWAGLAVPGWYGWRHERDVTYDLGSELDPSSESRRGLRLLRQHFQIGEINPVTLLLNWEADRPREVTAAAVRDLTRYLYTRDEVVVVRNADDPLGDFPPDRQMGMFSGDAWRRRTLKSHRLAQGYFYSDVPKYDQRLVRLDVAVLGDPFDQQTADRVVRLRQDLDAYIKERDRSFPGGDVYLLGTTASLIDLQTVITRDNRVIKVAVVLAVLAVLLVVIRKWVLCLYLIATVLISYYATLGLTMLFFRNLYGVDYVGLDWKLPLFLFVILVAIGQDYNVYLVTRIAEEEQRGGWLAALRRAVSRTGGIITACGLVMAATFFSMTASAWLPSVLVFLGQDPGPVRNLRGIVELGFALGLGMLIDTFYVRTILVPSFIAATRHIAASRSRGKAVAVGD